MCLFNHWFACLASSFSASNRKRVFEVQNHPARLYRRYQCSFHPSHRQHHRHCPYRFQNQHSTHQSSAPLSQRFLRLFTSYQPTLIDSELRKSLLLQWLHPLTAWSLFHCVLGGELVGLFGQSSRRSWRCVNGPNCHFKSTFLPNRCLCCSFEAFQSMKTIAVSSKLMQTR